MNPALAMSRRSAAGLAVLMFSAASAFAQETQAKPRPLRVMTYNIKHGQTNASCTQPERIPGQPPFPDCNLDLSASIEVMRAQGADVIGVQEVDRFWARSASLDEPAEMAAALGMNHYCYAPNLDHAPDSHANVPHQYGTVILSRFPILECENTLLRRTGTNEQRGLTRALFVLVYELTGLQASDPRSLVIEWGGGTKSTRLYQYPPNWRQLKDAELLALRPQRDDART